MVPQLAGAGGLSSSPRAFRNQEAWWSAELSPHAYSGQPAPKALRRAGCRECPVGHREAPSGEGAVHSHQVKQWLQAWRGASAPGFRQSSVTGVSPLGARGSGKTGSWTRGRLTLVPYPVSQQRAGLCHSVNYPGDQGFPLQLRRK